MRASDTTTGQGLAGFQDNGKATGKGQGEIMKYSHTILMGKDNKGRVIGKTVKVTATQASVCGSDENGESFFRPNGPVRFRVNVETLRNGKKFGAYNYGTVVDTKAEAVALLAKTVRKYQKKQTVEAKAWTTVRGAA